MKNFLLFAALIISLMILMPDKKITEEQIKKALKKTADKFGWEIAMVVEKMYRKETNNFKSENFKKTFGAGMAAVKNEYPFGWSKTFSDFWDKTPEAKPRYFIRQIDSGGYNVKFLRFPTLQGAMYTMALYLTKYPPGRWYSTDPEKAKRYEAELAAFKSPIINSMLV